MALATMPRLTKPSTRAWLPSATSAGLSNRLPARVRTRAATSLPMNEPAPAAARLAVRLLQHAESSLDTLFAASPGSASLAPLRSKMSGETLQYAAPLDRDPTERRSRVLPLTLTFCPELATAIQYQVRTQASPPFRPMQQQFAVQLARGLRTEDDLWIKARQHRMPYPFAYWTMQDMRKTDAKPGDVSMCLRCGCLLSATRKRATPARRCAACAKEPATVQAEWPSHAVMPHTQGTWWLRCQAADCTSLFIGRRHAKRCDAHRAEHVTRSRRAALRP